MQCTNISLYSKCKTYYMNHTTSFSTSWIFFSPCSLFPSTSHYKYWHFSFPALFTVSFLSCFLPPIYTSLPTLFTQIDLPEIHPKLFELPYIFPFTCTHLLLKITPPHFLSFLHMTDLPQLSSGKKGNRAIMTQAALLQELSFQQPIPKINTRRTLFLFWYPSTLELFQYHLIFFQLPRGHLKGHFI